MPHAATQRNRSNGATEQADIFATLLGVFLLILTTSFAQTIGATSVPVSDDLPLRETREADTQKTQLIVLVAADGRSLFLIDGRPVSLGNVGRHIKAEHNTIALVVTGVMPVAAVKKLRHGIADRSALPIIMGVMPKAWESTLSKWSKK